MTNEVYVRSSWCIYQVEVDAEGRASRAWRLRIMLEGSLAQVSPGQPFGPESRMWKPLLRLLDKGASRTMWDLMTTPPHRKRSHVTRDFVEVDRSHMPLSGG